MTRLAAALGAVMLLAGCTSMLVGSGGGRPAGGAIGEDDRSSAAVSEDARITATIESRYAADPSLGSAGIGVASYRGVVVLRGVVASFSLRDRAARLARDVRGVVRVDNQITVRTQ